MQRLLLPQGREGPNANRPIAVLNATPAAGGTVTAMVDTTRPSLTDGQGRCGVPTSHGSIGGRLITGCGAAATELVNGEMVCPIHASAIRAQDAQFHQLMIRATRHSEQIGVHGQGVRCLCGTFVAEGDLHPWDVPSVVEDHLEDLLLHTGEDSYPPAVREAIAAFRNGSSHPLLDTLAEACHEHALRQRR